MKKAKRFLALTLTAAMALGMLAGCGGSGGDETTAPQTSAVETGGAAAATEPQEKVEISIAIWGAEDGLANPDDPVLKKIEEETGVHLVPRM